MALAQNAAHLTRIHNMDPNYTCRPESSGRSRIGVHISQMEDTPINPDPVCLEEADHLLEQYLSPSKLTYASASPSEPHAEMLSERLLSGVDDLDDVQSLEMKVDTTETSLGNFGALLPNLRQLKLSDSIITGVRDLGSSLRGLHVLWLCRCGLKDLDGVASMTSLKELYLSYNELSDISAISMIDTLEILDLEGNYIDDVMQIQYLSLCQNLKSLSLEGNPVCLMPHPNSQQTNYNYREHVQEVLPDLQTLDEETLCDGAASVRKPNVFEDDWAYLEELQKDSLLLDSLVDTVNMGTEQGSRPGTAALRPATAFRPGTSMRRPETAFRPLTARSPTATRPQTSIRPRTSVRPVTSATRPSSTGSTNDEMDALSELTMGNVICGNPSRALKNRKKVIRNTSEEMEKIKHRYVSEGGDRVSSAEKQRDLSTIEDSSLDLAYQEEKKEWLKLHEKRMEKFVKEREPQVLVIEHNDIADDSITSLSDKDDDSSDEDSDFFSGRGHSFLSSQAGSEGSASRISFGQSKFRVKHDESFEADDDDVDDIRVLSSAGHRQQMLRTHSPVPPVMSVNSRQLPTPPSSARKIQSRVGAMNMVTTSTGLPAPVLRSFSKSGISQTPSPPSSAGSSSRGDNSHPRIRRQLPEVPGLPSRPTIPKS